MLHLQQMTLTLNFQKKGGNDYWWKRTISSINTAHNMLNWTSWKDICSWIKVILFSWVSVPNKQLSPRSDRDSVIEASFVVSELIAKKLNLIQKVNLWGRTLLLLQSCCVCFCREIHWDEGKPVVELGDGKSMCDLFFLAELFYH